MESELFTNSEVDEEVHQSHFSTRVQLTENRYQHRSLRTVDELGDLAFAEHYRLSRTKFEILLNEIGPYIYCGSRKYAIDVKTKVRYLYSKTCL